MSLRVIAAIHAAALCPKARAISPKMGEIPYGGVYIGARARIMWCAVRWVCGKGREKTTLKAAPIAGSKRVIEPCEKVMLFAHWAYSAR